MAIQIQIRRGTSGDWTSADTVLAEGELGLETDTKKFKLGNGTSTWTTLSYIIDPTAVPGGGVTALSSLTDVVLTSPSVGQVLKYNGTNWVNGTDNTGSSLPTDQDLYTTSTVAFAGVNFGGVEITNTGSYFYVKSDNVTMTNADWANTAFLLRGEGNINDSTGRHTISIQSGSVIADTDPAHGSGNLTFANPGSMYVDDTVGDFNFGYGDFTIETFLKISYGNVNANSNYAVASIASGSTTPIFLITTNGSATFASLSLWNGTFYINTNLSFAIDGTYHHLAWSRQGNTMYWAIDGNVVSTSISSYNFVNPANSFLVHQDYYNEGNYPVKMDDFRILKNVAKYTSNYSIPASAAFDQNYTVAGPMITLDQNLSKTSSVEFAGLKTKAVAETVVNWGSIGSGTYTPDASSGTVHVATLTDNITINAINNVQVGTNLTLILKQDGTGSRTLTSSMKFAGGDKTLTSAANSIDVISIFYDGTDYIASLNKDFK